MSTSDEFAFYAIAEPLVNLGIRVFPIQPGGKMPPYGMKFLEEATTDLGQIGSWHLQHRDYNVAMLADPALPRIRRAERRGGNVRRDGPGYA